LDAFGYVWKDLNISGKTLPGEKQPKQKKEEEREKMPLIVDT
jgi:hypothetical protein